MQKENNVKIESDLYDLLDELLSSGNQDGSIIELDYDSENNRCNVVLDVFIEGDYVAFQGY